MQNISPIKERILQFIDTHCSSKREFYAKTGISRGTLESKTGISEDTFTKIFATYHILSPLWVLNGIEPMIIVHSDAESHNQVSETKTDYLKSCKSCSEKERIIKAQDETIEALKETVAQLKSQIIYLHSQDTGTGLQNEGQKRKIG